MKLRNPMLRTVLHPPWIQPSWTQSYCTISSFNRYCCFTKKYESTVLTCWKRVKRSYALRFSMYWGIPAVQEMLTNKRLFCVVYPYFGKSSAKHNPSRQKRRHHDVLLDPYSHPHYPTNCWVTKTRTKSYHVKIRSRGRISVSELKTMWRYNYPPLHCRIASFEIIL